MLVTVATFTEPWEAHLFRSRLQAEGIPASIAHEHHVWNDWPYATALGGVKAQVLQSDLEAARAIEQRCRAGGFRAELDEEFGRLDGDDCPRCGTARTASRHSLPQPALLVASYVLSGVIFPLRSAVHRCPSCGATWHDKDRGPWTEAAH